MSTVALSHGYPPFWNMGGEVALHRAMTAIRGDRYVLTETENPYTFEGIHAKQINATNVLDKNSNPGPISFQLRELDAKVVIGQNELSLPAVRAAEMVNAVSIVNVHTPPQYGHGIKEAVLMSDYAVYNTRVAAREWGEPDALVLHPPISPLPDKLITGGDAYTVLSSLRNKGVEVVLEMAAAMPHQRFIIVRSPAEPTHGLPDIEARAAALPNVELHPRVPPEEVYKYFEQTRILLVPSRYETYGMSAIEAAGYGIPCVHVDTPHVHEGIGEGAILIKPLSTREALDAVKTIEKDYAYYSANARIRAEYLLARQELEMERFANFVATAQRLDLNALQMRRRNLDKTIRSIR